MVTSYPISNRKRYKFTPAGQVSGEYHDLKYWARTKNYKFSWREFRFVPYQKWNWVVVYTTSSLSGSVSKRIEKIQKEYDSVRMSKRKSISLSYGKNRLFSWRFN
jgi:hypothetical protein